MYHILDSGQSMVTISKKEYTVRENIDSSISASFLAAARSDLSMKLYSDDSWTARSCVFCARRQVTFDTKFDTMHVGTMTVSPP